MPAVSSLSIKEPVNPVLPIAPIPPNSVNNIFPASPFDNLSFGTDGLIHDRKGKRPRTTFESAYIGSSSLSSSLKTPPQWPLLSSIPHFTPSNDTSFNAGSLGVSFSTGTAEENVICASLETDFGNPNNHNSDLKEVLVLEPMSLSMLPQEPVVTDEEFDKEIDLMMMDPSSMDAEPSSAHNLEE